MPSNGRQGGWWFEVPHTPVLTQGSNTLIISLCSWYFLPYSNYGHRIKLLGSFPQTFPTTIHLVSQTTMSLLHWNVEVTELRHSDSRCWSPAHVYMEDYWTHVDLRQHVFIQSILAIAWIANMAQSKHHSGVCGGGGGWGDS